MSGHLAILPATFLIFAAALVGILMWRSITDGDTTLSPTISPSDNLMTVEDAETGSPTPATFSPSRAPTLPLDPQNVLLIVVDDLRGAVASFGDQSAKTPNIDSLASKGLRFTNHHVSLSDSAPSRASFLTGKRPDELLIFEDGQYLRDKNANLMTMPGHFRRVGYRSVAIGRLFHRASFAPSPSPYTDICASSSATLCSFDVEIPVSVAVANTSVCPLGATTYPLRSGGTNPLLFYGESLDVNVDTTERFIDSCLVRHAEAQLQEFSFNSPRRFFLAVGLSRPQIPWSVPREAWNQFAAAQEESLAYQLWARDISGATFFTEQSSPSSQKSGWSELNGFTDEASIPTARKLRGYYASVAYIDAMVGRLTDAVLTHSDKNIRENTIIVLWSDNGIHLGPLLWGPKTIFEQSTRTPLLIVPSVAWRNNHDDSTGVGKVVDWPVESIDVYPTLIEMANVDPLNGVASISGKSLAQYFFSRDAPLKPVAVSQCPDYRPFFARSRMGYAVRSRYYRLVRYYIFDPDCFLPSSRAECAYSFQSGPGMKQELYFYASPGRHEEVNVYGDPNHAAAQAELEAIMNARNPGWTALGGTEVG